MTADTNIRLYLRLLSWHYIDHLRTARALGDTDSQGFAATTRAYAYAYAAGRAYLLGEPTDPEQILDLVVVELNLCPDCLADKCSTDCPRIRSKYAPSL